MILGANVELYLQSEHCYKFFLKQKKYVLNV